MLNLNKAKQMKHITLWYYYTPLSITVETSNFFSHLVI